MISYAATVQRGVGKLRNEMLDALEKRSQCTVGVHSTTWSDECNGSVVGKPPKSAPPQRNRDVIEGGVRRLVSLEKGEEWVKLVTIDLAESLVGCSMNMLQDTKRPSAH